jgi:parallel beta-helix repeat protein
MRTCTSGVIVCLLAAAVSAGPLNPPAGAVAPAFKTLSEVEPRIAVNSTNTPNGGATSLYVISQPGSYYLTGNVTATAIGNAIQITANNVTLDLNGFTVNGFAGSGVPALLIIGDGAGGASNARGNVTVRNGTVRGVGGAGVNSSANHALEVRLIDVTARGCTGSGFAVEHGTVLERCAAYGNTGAGFILGSGCVATGCVARGNTGNEWDMQSNNVLTACVAENTGTSGYGFSMTDGNTLTGCVASGSSVDAGFSMNMGNTLMNCSSRLNGGSGFAGGAAGNTLTGCTGSDNGAHGFSFTGCTTITGCNGFSNTQHGLLVTNGSIVTGCAFNGNGSDGMRISNNCVATNNACSLNAGSGILATSPGNRIEGNTVVGNGSGITVPGGCVVVRNTASKNPSSGSVGVNDFVLTGSNAVGQIFDVSAGATITTGNSFANFKY